MNKPVWRINTAKGIPSDFADKIMYFDGLVTSILPEFRECDSLWVIEGRHTDTDIYAYQTTRIKEAKYE